MQHWTEATFTIFIWGFHHRKWSFPTIHNFNGFFKCLHFSYVVFRSLFNLMIYLYLNYLTQCRHLNPFGDKLIVSVIIWNHIIQNWTHIWRRIKVHKIICYPLWKVCLSNTESPSKCVFLKSSSTLEIVQTREGLTFNKHTDAKQPCQQTKFSVFLYLSFVVLQLHNVGFNPLII